MMATNATHAATHTRAAIKQAHQHALRTMAPAPARADKDKRDEIAKEVNFMVALMLVVAAVALLLACPSLDFVSSSQTKPTPNQKPIEGNKSSPQRVFSPYRAFWLASTFSFNFQPPHCKGRFIGKVSYAMHHARKDRAVKKRPRKELPILSFDGEAVTGTAGASPGLGQGDMGKIWAWATVTCTVTEGARRPDRGGTMR
jgi:hypothetical protein